METKKFFNAVRAGKNLTERMQTYHDVYSGFLNILPNPSKLIKEHGYKLFAETAADSTVRGAVNTVFEGISSLEWEIVKNDASDKEIELAYSTIEKLMKNNLVKQILWAIFYGFQPLNAIWKLENNLYSIDKLIELPHDTLVMDKERNPKILVSNSALGVEPDPYRLLLVTYDSNYNNPYGTGLFLNCYKHIFIKNNIIDFWTVFAEDYGSPGILGKFTQQASTIFQMAPEEFVTYFYNQLADMRQNKVVVTPEGTDISSIPSGSVTSADIYRGLIEFSKAEINNIILGHESASSSTPGKLGNEQMAFSAKVDRVEAYTEFLTYHVNELLKWQHDLNFPSNEACEIRFFEKDDIQKYTQKAVLAKELSAIGVEFNEDYIEEHFNIDKKFFKLKQITNQPATEPLKATALNKFFALADKKLKEEEENNDVLEKFTDYVLNSDEFANLKEDTLNVITKEISKFNSFDEMLDNVYDVFDKLDIENKKDVVTKFMLISAVYGYNNEVSNG